MLELRDAKKIVLDTRHSSNAFMNSTGGDYDEATILYKDDKKGVWWVEYWTSADLQFCRNCGRYGCDGDEREPDDFHYCPEQEMTEDEVKELLRRSYWNLDDDGVIRGELKEIAEEEDF